MPSAPAKRSSASKYSWVAPGPPCSSSSLIRGLLPKRLVQTLKSPFGVWIGIYPDARRVDARVGSEVGGEGWG